MTGLYNKKSQGSLRRLSFFKILLVICNFIFLQEHCISLSIRRKKQSKTGKSEMIISLFEIVRSLLVHFL